MSTQVWSDEFFHGSFPPQMPNKSPNRPMILLNLDYKLQLTFGSLCCAYNIFEGFFIEIHGINRSLISIFSTLILSKLNIQRICYWAICLASLEKLFYTPLHIYSGIFGLCQFFIVIINFSKLLVDFTIKHLSPSRRY